MVTRRPFGTCRIKASTSRGAGDDHRAVPQRWVSLPVTGPIFGAFVMASFRAEIFSFS